MKKEKEASKLEKVGILAILACIFYALGLALGAGTDFYLRNIAEGVSVLPQCDGYLFWGENRDFNAKILSCRE